MDIPILVAVSLTGISDAGQIDTEIYCVNLTDKPFQVSTRSTSFTTVDEDTGAVVEHGSSPEQMILLPGEAKKVGDVAGWEWDGHVGIELRFREEGGAADLRASYDLKRAAESFKLETLDKTGRIIPPGFIKQS